MWCQALLAAIAVACTFTRVHAKGPQRLDQIKDLLCVLISSGIQKEDLDESTLQKLQRHNVNINELNNEELKNKCKIFEKNKSKEQNTTKENIGHWTEGKTLQNGTLDISLNKYNGNKIKNENNILSTRKHNCNDMIKYHNGKPNLNTMLDFWKKCVYVNKSNANYEMQLNKKSISIYTTKSTIKIKQNNLLGVPSNQKLSEIDSLALNSLRQENTKEINQSSPKIMDLDDSYYYTPPPKYNTKTYMENIIEQLILNNQDKKNEHASSKRTPEELLMQKLHTVFNNYNRQILKRDNLKERPEIGDGYFNPNISNGNFLYSENIPNKNIQGTEPVKVDVSPNFVPVIPDDQVLYREIDPNNYSHIRESVNIDELPKFIHSKADNNHIYRENEPNEDPFRKERIKANYLPKINPYTLYPESERKKDKFQSESKRLIDTSKITPNISSINTVYDENIPNKNSYRTNFSKVEETSKLIPNNPIHNGNLYYREGEPNKFQFRRETKRADDLSRIIPDIPKLNFSYRANVPNKDSNRKKNVEMDNTSKLINKRENELNKYSHRKDAVNVDKSEKIIDDTPDGNIFDQQNEPTVESLKNKPVEMNDKSKIIPNKPDGNILFGEDIPNKDLYFSDKIDESSIFIHNVAEGKKKYGKIVSTKSWYRNGSTNADETSKSISNTTDDKPNKDSLKNESLKEKESKTIPSNIIKDIAESIKAIILKDLKKELNMVSTTISSTVITTPSTTEHTQSSAVINGTAIQEAVMNKVVKLLEQMNILQGNAFSMNKIRSNNKNTNIIESDFKTSTTETVYGHTEDKPIQVTRSSVDYNFGPQLHKNRHTYINKNHKNVRTPPQAQTIIKTGPITFQTNSLEIRPLGIYVDRLMDPINQNIILTTGRPKIFNLQREISPKDNNGRLNFINLQKKQDASNYYLQNAIKTVTSNVNTNDDLEISMDRGINSKYNNNYKDEDENNNNAPKFYERQENIDDKLALDPKLPLDREYCCERQHMSQAMRDCCNESVASRQQVPLNNAQNRPFDDTHYKTFINSQKKVNDMLAEILGSRNKFRSVENI